MSDPTPPPRQPARVGLLVAGLLLAVAGVAVVAWVLASAGGLVGGGDPPPMADAPATAGPAATTTPGAEARTVAYRLEPANGPTVTVRLELAADPAARARGLMGRRQVPEGTGMVFLYPTDVAEAFWMKDTLVPLSIAYISSDGRIAEIRDMSPESLQAVESERSVRFALEVPQGWFGRVGVGVGDRLVVPERELRSAE